MWVWIYLFSPQVSNNTHNLFSIFKCSLTQAGEVEMMPISQREERKLIQALALRCWSWNSNSRLTAPNAMLWTITLYHSSKAYSFPILVSYNKKPWMATYLWIRNCYLPNSSEHFEKIVCLKETWQHYYLVVLLINLHRLPAHEKEHCSRILDLLSYPSFFFF